MDASTITPHEDVLAKKVKGAHDVYCEEEKDNWLVAFRTDTDTVIE